MDLNSALDIIIKDLREAREIISDLRNYKGVPAIQVELAKAKCKSAEEIITLLKTLYPAGDEISAREEATAVQTEKEKKSGPVGEEKTENTEPVVAVVAPPDAEVKPVQVPGTESLSENRQVAAAEEATSSGNDKGSVIGSGPVPPAGPGKEKVRTSAISETGSPVAARKQSAVKGETGRPILADRFGEVENRINESMHGRRPEDDISSRIKQSPISNLADAIGINDRFYYTREIFGGSSDTYRDAIARLNNASGFKEAEGIIKECAGNETNPEAVRELLALVKRKTGSDE